MMQRQELWYNEEGKNMDKDFQQEKKGIKKLSDNSNIKMNNNSYREKSVAIIGMAVIFSQANND